MTAPRAPREILNMIVRLLFVCGFVATSQQPVTAQETSTLTQIGIIDGPIDLVEVRGGYAYTTHHTDLTVYDISDPASPTAVGALSLPEEIWGFRIANNRVYLGANFHGLAIADISDPTNPHILGVHKSLGQTKIGDVYENRVGLIDHMEGFVLIDVSSESTPTSVGSFFLDGYARDVVTSGSIAYATDSPTGLYIFDLSQDGLPEPIAVLHAPSAPRTSLGVTELRDGTTVLAGIGGANLQLFDVSDPTAPRKTADFDTPGDAFGVSLHGNLAYVADGSAGVQVVDLTTPDAPRVVNSFTTERPARSVSATHDYVFAVVGDSEREGDDRHVVILEVVR